MKKLLCLFSLCICFCLINSASCWSNGGYSVSSSAPKHGTHDWIAEKALNFLPEHEKEYIMNSINLYLYGTEMPDNPEEIGDTTKHHVYFSEDGTLIDDSSAKRAQEEYDKARRYLANNEFSSAAMYAGVTTHYIADMAVFGHVMGSSAWGTEKHHSDYESYVDSHLAMFEQYLIPDGLEFTSAYNATVSLAYDTTFDGEKGYGCVWMDDSCYWDNTDFVNRCGESINLAVNKIADVLHTLYNDVSPVSTVNPTPNFTWPPSTPTPTWSWSYNTTSISPSPSPSLNIGDRNTYIFFVLVFGVFALFLILSLSRYRPRYTSKTIF